MEVSLILTKQVQRLVILLTLFIAGFLWAQTSPETADSDLASQIVRGVTTAQSLEIAFITGIHVSGTVFIANTNPPQLVPNVEVYAFNKTKMKD
ncbi:MAG: hypothetical protein GY943_00770 [Chloroflexi bacterium]|nr:hypothetical protein [Chloroflexota bacterium]